LEGVGDFLNTTIGSVTAVGLLLTATTGLLAKKIVEKEVNKQQLELQRLQTIQLLEQRKEQIILSVLEKQGLKGDATELKNLAKILAAKQQINRLEAEKNKIQKTGATTTTEDEKTKKLTEDLNAQAAATVSVAEAQSALDKGLAENKELHLQYQIIEERLSLLRGKNNGLMSQSIVVMAAKLV
jgi:hypothetical protein